MIRRKPGPGQYLAWARVNAYGLLLVGLLLLTFTDVIHPDTSVTAKLLGSPHFLQQYWASAFLLGGFFLLWGFISARTWPEVFGLVIIVIGQVVRTIVVNDILGWFTTEGLQGSAVGLLLIGMSALRLSILTSKHGFTITIPGREGIFEQEKK